MSGVETDLSLSSSEGFFMARQPLNSRHPKGGFSLGPGFLENRPEASILIAQCIATWTEVELQTARLLGKLLRANTEPAIAMYLRLGNDRAKREIMKAVADFVLGEKDNSLFDAIMKAKSSLDKQRNDLAHGLFGITEEDLDGVIWVSTADRIKNMLLVDKFISDGKSSELGPQIQKLREFVSHYSLGDLRRIFNDIQSMHQIMYKFVGYVSDPTEGLYHTLSHEPLIREFLSPSSSNPKSGS
jgi:hypothetical protein